VIWGGSNVHLGSAWLGCGGVEAAREGRSAVSLSCMTSFGCAVHCLKERLVELSLHDALSYPHHMFADGLNSIACTHVPCRC
jgi:hypothetical protein